MDFKVSVIIPFYNARTFVTQAVESALSQPETGEVLLVEDGSPDGGIDVCKHLANKYPSVFLLQHENGANRGAAASRNLGIKNASCPFIAFLDADDYYLPNRFTKTSDVFHANLNANGIYEATGTYFENPRDHVLYHKCGLPLLTTISDNNIAPQDLFVALMRGGVGYFHLDGFTATANFLKTHVCFDERLILFEDTDFMYKVSLAGNLYAGKIDEPVAMRRVHNDNRITQELNRRRETYHRVERLWQNLFIWGKYRFAGENLKWVLRRRFANLRKIDDLDDPQFREIFAARMTMLVLAFQYPQALIDPYCWRRALPSKKLLRQWLRPTNHNITMSQ